MRTPHSRAGVPIAAERREPGQDGIGWSGGGGAGALWRCGATALTASRGGRRWLWG